MYDVYGERFILIDGGVVVEIVEEELFDGVFDFVIVCFVEVEFDVERVVGEFVNVV